LLVGLGGQFGRSSSHGPTPSSFTLRSGWRGHDTEIVLVRFRVNFDRVSGADRKTRATPGNSVSHRQRVFCDSEPVESRVEARLVPCTFFNVGPQDRSTPGATVLDSRSFPQRHWSSPLGFAFLLLLRYEPWETLSEDVELSTKPSQFGFDGGQLIFA